LRSSPLQELPDHPVFHRFKIRGDGSVEVLIYDTGYLHVYRGTDGVELFKVRNGSLTTTEYPVVADIDGDSHAEILIASQIPYIDPLTKQKIAPGLQLIQDRNDTWMPTRRIWNQYAYSIDNINDDATIPAHPANGWLVHNSYRQNAYPHGKTNAVADLTVSDFALFDDGTSYSLQFTVRNRGLAPSLSDVDVEIIQGNPETGGQLLGSVTIAPLPFGETSTYSLSGLNVTDINDQLYARINGTKSTEECDYENNIIQAPVVRLSVQDARGLADSQLFVISAVANNNQESQIDTALLEPAVIGEKYSQKISAIDKDKGDGSQQAVDQKCTRRS